MYVIKEKVSQTSVWNFTTCLNSMFGLMKFITPKLKLPHSII